jgi:hypothetical protein
MASPSSTRADSIQLASLELPGCLHLPLPSLAGGPFNPLPISPNKWWTSWWISWWSSCIFDQWPPPFWPDFALGERKNLMALLLLSSALSFPFSLTSLVLCGGSFVSYQCWPWRLKSLSDSRELPSLAVMRRVREDGLTEAGPIGFVRFSSGDAVSCWDEFILFHLSSRTYSGRSLR